MTPTPTMLDRLQRVATARLSTLSRQVVRYAASNQRQGSLFGSHHWTDEDEQKHPRDEGGRWAHTMSRGEFHQKKYGTDEPQKYSFRDLMATINGNREHIQLYSRSTGRNALIVKYSLRTKIEFAAQQTDISPSPDAIAAGNYRKGRFRWHGREIVIENPRGSIRSGTNKTTGKQWSVVMPHHYGYFRQTESEADGDHIDCFVGRHPESEVVFVIDQKKKDGDTFDEHKCMVGFRSAGEAKAAYLAAYSPGWRGFQNISTMTLEQFQEWLDSGDSSRPVSGTRSLVKYAGLFDSEKHPRGQPGNAGEFAKKNVGVDSLNKNDLNESIKPENITSSGSANYNSRIASGWSHGSARYVSEEPHHRNISGSWVYEVMHNEKLDEKIARVIDGTGEIGEKVSGVTLRWSELRGFSIARSVSGIVELVPIPAKAVEEFNAETDLGNGEHEDSNATLSIQEHPNYEEPKGKISPPFEDRHGDQASQPIPQSVSGQQQGLFDRGEFTTGQKSLFNVIAPDKPKSGKGKAKTTADLFAGMSSDLKAALKNKATISPADAGAVAQSPTLPGQKDLFQRGGRSSGSSVVRYEMLPPARPDWLKPKASPSEPSPTDDNSPPQEQPSKSANPKPSAGPGGWQKVGGSSVFVNSSGKITKGCPGLKGHAVGELIDESDESRDRRAAKQDHATARGLTGHDLSATAANKFATKSKVSQHQAAKSSAKRAGVATTDVLAHVPEAESVNAAYSRRLEEFKADARKKLGLNAGNLHKIEDTGHDYNNVKHFDLVTGSLEEEFPDVMHNKSDPAQFVWDTLKQGKAPKATHANIADEAADMVAAASGRMSQAFKAALSGPAGGQEPDTSFSFGALAAF